MKLIFEISRPGRRAYQAPEPDVPAREIDSMIPKVYLRAEVPDLPEVSEVEAVRHFTHLSQRNHGVDSGFYPLGSCTMKYNPKINEEAALLPGFTGMHPFQPPETAQGCLKLMYELDGMLSEITGMDRVSLQPAAGAHGELTGLMMIKAYHDWKHATDPVNNPVRRTKIIIPDSAHGTNPASAAAAGFETIEIKSGTNGGVDLSALREVAGPDTAGLMLTNPSTLGLFEENICEIADIVHKAGGLLYYDGANANAIMGITRPGDMGFDVVHLNLHKTFSTPHGGGGPGSGPVGVKKELIPFLPVPVIEIRDIEGAAGTIDTRGTSDTGVVNDTKEVNQYYADYDRPLSIGKVRSYYGNFGIAVRAYAYIMALGADGLKQVSENAVLNANYIMERLKNVYSIPYDRSCMHEFVMSCASQKFKANGITALDVAKRLIDFGFHPPTVYFPLIVKEAVMIEPTETESRETLDEFIEAMLAIADEAETNPELLKTAPHTTPVSRPDDVAAARTPILKYGRV